MAEAAEIAGKSQGCMFRHHAL